MSCINEPSYSGNVGGRNPPQATDADEPSHSRQQANSIDSVDKYMSGATHKRKILNKSAAQVIEDCPEVCFVVNVGTLAVKLGWHSYFGFNSMLLILVHWQ